MKKLTLNYVKQYHLKHNSVCLAKSYIDAHTKYEYICECSNKSETNFNNFKNGKRCKKCGERKTREGQPNKHTLEYIKKFHLEKNSVCLAEKYVNLTTKYSYVCECGSTDEISFQHFKVGHRCKKCREEKTKGENNHNWNPDRDYIKLRKKISGRCSALVRKVLKKIGLKKTSKSAILLGYTRKELLDHIISHPNFEKVKDGNWHIDHIFPVIAFVKNGITDLKIINALSNLQPLSEFDNCSKGNKYDSIEFKTYLLNYNIII